MTCPAFIGEARKFDIPILKKENQTILTCPILKRENQAILTCPIFKGETNEME